MYRILVNLRTVSRERVQTETTRFSETTRNHNEIRQKINYYFENCVKVDAHKSTSLTG